MAEDSNKPNHNSQEIDLDNIEVEILIICKNQNALNQSSSFLTRRGWPTTVVTDIGRAVENIADKRPDFVLVSLSHPSTSIAKLPDLITQTFNIHCIGFVETTDASSSARLAQAKMRYKIQGQASGPAIHRTLRKILAERFHLDAAEEQANAESTSEDVMTRIAGGSAADGGVIIQKSSANMTAGKGAQVIRGSESDLVEIDQEEVDALLSGTPLDENKKPRISLKAIEQANEADSTGDMLFGQSVDKNRKPHVTRMPTEDLVAEMKRSLFGENGVELTAYIPAPEGAGESPAVKPKDRTTQGLMEKAVDGAMGRLCQSIPGVSPLPLEEMGHVGICPVDNGDQSGYLVVVWQAPDQIVREEFLRSCEREIQNAFSAMNVQGKLEPAFWAQLPSAHFAEFANAHAQFTIISAHQKREVGVAFFPTGGPLAKPVPPASEHGMYSVGVEKISTEFPVNFKAFIHFVNNNRFFLYLRNGRVLQPEQKARLQEHKINNFYMQSKDLENMRQYMATSFLAGLIKRLKKAA
jgi:CheY-like chemotaxis protein